MTPFPYLYIHPIQAHAYLSPFGVGFVFSEVDAILFVAALSDDEKSLSETKSEKDNRMIAALALLKSIVEFEGFVYKRIPIILFLNKKNIFRKKTITNLIYCQSEFKDYRVKDFVDGYNYFMSKNSQSSIDTRAQTGYLCANNFCSRYRTYARRHRFCPKDGTGSQYASQSWVVNNFGRIMIKLSLS